MCLTYVCLVVLWRPRSSGLTITSFTPSVCGRIPEGRHRRRRRPRTSSWVARAVSFRGTWLHPDTRPPLLSCVVRSATVLALLACIATSPSCAASTAATPWRPASHRRGRVRHSFPHRQRLLLRRRVDRLDARGDGRHRALPRARPPPRRRRLLSASSLIA